MSPTTVLHMRGITRGNTLSQRHVIYRNRVAAVILLQLENRDSEWEL